MKKMFPKLHPQILRMMFPKVLPHYTKVAMTNAVIPFVIAEQMISAYRSVQKELLGV